MRLMSWHISQSSRSKCLLIIIHTLILSHPLHPSLSLFFFLPLSFSLFLSLSSSLPLSVTLSSTIHPISLFLRILMYNLLLVWDLSNSSTAPMLMLMDVNMLHQLLLNTEQKENLTLPSLLLPPELQELLELDLK